MRAKKNLFASYSFILINILINLFVVRLAVKEFGEQLYAFIVLAFSFITYVESFNLGVYISNRTQIPIRSKHASVYTVASFKFLSLIAGVLLVIWGVIYGFWADDLVLAITTERSSDILLIGKKLICIGVVYGIVKIPFSLVLSAFAGQDLVDVEKKYNTLQQILKISSLFIVMTFNLSVLTYLYVFTILGILLLVIANVHYYYQFIHTNKHLYLRYSKNISSGFIAKNSFKFYVFTMANVVVWSTDNLLVSIFFNPKMVTDYHINFSIYNAAFLFISAIAGALIANYGNLIKTRELDKLNFRLNLSVYTTMAIALAIAFGGFLFSKEIISLWVGQKHFLSTELCLSFAFFGLTIALSSVVNTLLSLFASSKVITSMTISEAILNLALSVILLKVIGVVGIALATGIAALVTIVIPGSFILKKHFNDQLFVKWTPLLFQLILCILFIVISLNLDLSLLARIASFIAYSVTSFGLLYISNKDYLKSYSKIIGYK